MGNIVIGCRPAWRGARALCQQWKCPWAWGSSSIPKVTGPCCEGVKKLEKWRKEPQPLLGAFFPKHASRPDPAKLPVQDAVFPSPGKPSAPLCPAPSAWLAARQPCGKLCSCWPRCLRVAKGRKRGAGWIWGCWRCQLEAVSKQLLCRGDTESQEHHIPAARVGWTEPAWGWCGEQHEREGNTGPWHGGRSPALLLICLPAARGQRDVWDFTCPLHPLGD